MPQTYHPTWTLWRANPPILLNQTLVQLERPLYQLDQPTTPTFSPTSSMRSSLNVSAIPLVRPDGVRPESF